MKLFRFEIFVFCSQVLYSLVLDADQVVKNPKMSHFVRGAMTLNTLYALNQVLQCHIKPSPLEIRHTKIIHYSKPFRKERSAAKCRLQH